MSYLFFMDESGHDHRSMPYEVRGGIVLRADRVWPFIQAVRSLEAGCFGSNLPEIKGQKLADKDRWRWANQATPMPDDQRREHAAAFLAAADNARPPRRHEFTAYGQACVEMGRGIFQLLEEHGAMLLASFVPKAVARPRTYEAMEFLRKDHVFLMQRYFWLLEERGETGLIVMDRCEHNADGHFAERMEKYFTSTTNGRVRATLIVPYPFFVDSHLTCPVQVADFCIYCLNASFRMPHRGLNAPARADVASEYRVWLEKLQFRGREIRDGRSYRIRGYCYVPDPYTGR